MRTHIAYSVLFGHGGNAEDFLLYGWHLQEPHFAWATGPESAVCFPRLVAPYGCFVELHVHPLVIQSGPQSQRITIAANGMTVGEMMLTKETVFAFFVPPLDWQSRRFVLTFRHPDAYAAAPGTNAVAISFTRIRVLVLDEPMPTACRRPLIASGTSPADTAPDTDPLLRDVALSFTSLGFNCEFGFVQRQMGAEPIDLLRFAGIPLIRLIYGIDAEFAGLDEPDNLRPEDSRTRDVRDRTYNIAYHTFLTADDVTWDELVAREVRRLRFLANKLIGDMEDAGKVFVWWQRTPITLAEIVPLFLAMRRRGRIRLLWVELGDSQLDVEEIWPGLLHGHISRLTEPGQHNMPGMFSVWLPILTTVRADR